ncbi:hypothetical protein [Desulfoluna spongiiphila]|uniref:Ethanolamine utilization protein n=1 Tax=Desulfoluna spongiiphila TaxID=419481 RepID=A0A1G5EAR4_9BACT|nr:hypothetical protein [Desulfoluna spongiiphila]SCY24027.1 hypothetical protein SAMN05216233_105267 [Desulfoluna spongiiphila]
MDVEALVKAIAIEVLKQVNGDSETTRVLIIGEKTCPKCQAVQKRLGKGHTFLYPDEDPGPGETLRRIVPYLSIRHMADMASGKADGPLMETAFRAMLAGQTVEVVEFEYKRHADTAPEGLMRLFEGQEAALAGYGLVAMDVTKRDSVRIRKPLVTEADVAEAGGQGAKELRLPADAQVTPLAVESAKDLGITLSRG